MAIFVDVMIKGGGEIWLFLIDVTKFVIFYIKIVCAFEHNHIWYWLAFQ